MDKWEEYLNNLAEDVLKNLHEFGIYPLNYNKKINVGSSWWHELVVWFEVEALEEDSFNYDAYKPLKAFINDVCRRFVDNNPPLKGSRISRYEFDSAFPFVSKGTPEEFTTPAFHEGNSDWVHADTLGFYIEVKPIWEK